MRHGQTRYQADRDDPDDPANTPSPAGHQQQWKEDVVLFLDRQAPGVQQRLQASFGGEITTLEPEENVRRKNRDCGETFAEILEVTGNEQCPREGYAGGHDKKQSWQNSSGATFVEVDEAEGPLLQVVKDDGCNQIPADDKKYIDTHKATAEPGKTRVEKDDGQHGHGSQSIDFGSVEGRHLRGRCGSAGYGHWSLGMAS